MDREPGWDAKAIARIATEHYGSLLGLFEAMGWPERGAAMMPAQQRRVVEAFGSVQAFADFHASGQHIDPASLFDGSRDVLLTSFWGWTPETWGTVGFTQAGRMQTIVRDTSDPFVVVIYVTKQAPNRDRDVAGKVCGFYLVSHETGHRNEFTAATHHATEPAKWQHSLRATRAFTFLPEYRLSIDAFDPTVKDRAQSIAQSAEWISDDGLALLRALPFVEVPVFRGQPVSSAEIVDPRRPEHKVRGGASNHAGYYVDGEPVDAEKELYALRLEGDMSAFLRDPPAGRSVYKIGLSMSPKSRLQAFRKALPHCAFDWVLHRSTRMDGGSPYPGFIAAEAGENAMKDVLGLQGEWLGGEFYAAVPDVFEKAWVAGRVQAQAASK